MTKILEDDLIIITESDDIIELKFKKNEFGKSFKEFMKQFPGYSSEAIKIGADALSQYKSVKNLTARFFAQTPLEKKLYSDMVNILTKSGKFKQITKKIKDGGLYYELVKQ